MKLAASIIYLAFSIFGWVVFSAISGIKTTDEKWGRAVIGLVVCGFIFDIGLEIAKSIWKK